MRGLLLLCLVPGVLHAQQRCVDSLSGSSWRSTPLRTLVTSPAPGERDADRYADRILPLLAQRFHDPTERLQASARIISVAPESERTPVAVTLRLRLDRNGRLLSTTLVTGSGNAALDTSIVEAVQQAAGERG
ncbi:MAG TPA: TonB C-terminal domain-containing protein, partial [Gemmatimonadales bacterium]|nr:TonB C-terminal domain-containing protein [Gemmatimonadales bacterium]